MSLQRFQQALAEAKRKPRVEIRDAMGDQIDVTEAEFKKLFKSATGKAPTKKDIAAAKKNGYDIPDTRRARTQSFRIKMDRFLKKHRRPRSTIPYARGPATKTPLAQRRSKHLRWTKATVSNPMKMLSDFWKFDKDWRFALDGDKLPAGSGKLPAAIKDVPEDLEPGEPSNLDRWKMMISSMSKEMLANLILMSPNFKEMGVAVRPDVMEFMRRTNLTGVGKSYVMFRSDSAKLARDVLQWVASNRLTYPHLLAAHLFNVFTPKLVRGGGVTPADAFIRGKNLVIVPPADSLGVMPDFWALTTGPQIQKLQKLERRIKLAQDRLPRLETRIQELQDMLADPESGAKVEDAEELSAAQEEMIGIRNLLGKADKVKSIKVTPLLKTIKAIQGWLKKIGKGLEIKGPTTTLATIKGKQSSEGFKLLKAKLKKQYGSGASVRQVPEKGVVITRRTSMPRSFTKFKPGSREAALDPLTTGSPLRKRIQLLGKLVRPGDPTSEDYNRRLRALVGRLVKAQAAGDSPVAKDTIEKIVELNEKFYKLKKRETEEMADNGKTLVKGRGKNKAAAWKPLSDAIRSYKSLAKLYTFMGTLGLPDSKKMTKRGDAARKAAEKLRKSAEKAFAAALKDREATVKERYKSADAKDRNAAKATAKMQARWEALWQGF